MNSIISFEKDFTFKNKIEKIGNWLVQLLGLTKKTKDEETKDFIKNLTLLLSNKYTIDLFTLGSLEFVASKHSFFPSYADLCKTLEEFGEMLHSREKEEQRNANAYPFLQDLSIEAKIWVENWLTNQAVYWKKPNETSISFEETDRRKKRDKNFIKQYCSEAFDFLFPEEKNNFITSWTTEGVLNSIQELNKFPINSKRKINLIKHLFNAVQKNCPENLSLIIDEYGSKIDFKEAADS